MGETWCRPRAGRRARPLRLAFLLLLCALPVLAGCGGNGESSPQPAVERPTPPAVEEPEEEEPAEEPLEPEKPAEPVEPEEPGDPDEPGEDPEEETPASPFTQEGLDELVQQVLDRIITPEMTQLEQAKAVWDYAKTNIRYTGTSDKSDWQAEAYAGLSRRRGDCFTYYAVSRALLTALDIENMEVQRVGGKTSHYWNLVNCGDGWYHFDATPRNVRMPRFVSFMFTDADAAAYTAMAGRNYYTFDGSLYPERGDGPPADIRPAPPLPDDEELDPEDPDLDTPDLEDPDGEITDPEDQNPDAASPEGQEPETTDPAGADPGTAEDPASDPSDGPELGTEEEPGEFPPEPVLPAEEAVPSDGGEPQPELGAENQ